MTAQKHDTKSGRACSNISKRLDEKWTRAYVSDGCRLVEKRSQGFLQVSSEFACAQRHARQHGSEDLEEILRYDLLFRLLKESALILQSEVWKIHRCCAPQIRQE